MQSRISGKLYSLNDYLIPSIQDRVGVGTNHQPLLPAIYALHNLEPMPRRNFHRIDTQCRTILLRQPTATHQMPVQLQTTNNLIKGD
jgi:hypothetical protein